MKSVAIITARGGSKTIPHKNIKPFLENLFWNTALKLHLGQTAFREVMVSTDDEEIARIASACRGYRGPL